MNVHTKNVKPPNLSPSRSLLAAVLHMLGSLTKLNRIDSLGETKRAETLVATLNGRAQVDKHQCLTIATETVLEEIGQLGVTEGNVFRSIGK
mmetsp:Transcript_20532/g.34767  ORF Transcript_20532/g.34767 Transcript_20532/m.34767 type:complete len:92 (-) Transcript_20532:1499-1774(-)